MPSPDEHPSLANGSPRAETLPSRSQSPLDPLRPVDTLKDTMPVDTIPGPGEFNTKCANDPTALRQFETNIKKADAGVGRISWDDKGDTMLLLEGLKKIEEGGGELVATKGRANNLKLVTITCKTGDSGLQGPAQTFLTWILREYGSASMAQVTQQQVKNKHTDIRAIWHAIKMLDTASGDPFHYDVHAGYGHVTGELGVELDQLMSNQGDEVAGRSNLVKHAQKLKPFRNRPWPCYTKVKEIFEDIRNESSLPRGTLARTFHERDAEDDNNPGETSESVIDPTQSAGHVPNTASDGEHSDDSNRERDRRRVAGARGSGGGKRSRANTSRDAAEKLSQQLLAIKEAVSAATENTSKLNDMRQESLKLDKHAALRDAVRIIEEADAFKDATRSQQRLLIKHLKVGDNSLDFVASGMTLRDEWIEDASKVLEREVRENGSIAQDT